MRTGISFDVSSADRRRLEAIIRNRNAPQKHVWRAEIVLLSDQQEMQQARPMVDDNADGVVSADEAASRHEQMFQLIDANNDGVLDIHEFVAFGGHGRYSRQERRAERFQKMDGDDDGNVIQAEFIRDGKARYESADMDGDGQVTVWEWRASPRY